MTPRKPGELSCFLPKQRTHHSYTAYHGKPAARESSCLQVCYPNLLKVPAIHYGWDSAALTLARSTAVFLKGYDAVQHGESSGIWTLEVVKIIVVF